MEVMYRIDKLLRLFLLTLLVLPLASCRPPEALPPKAPRPVSVVTLKAGLPPSEKRLTGSVGSWKTEQIGFEVAGRVRWVLEPGEDIEGRVLDANGEVVTQGTALAQVDAERYELALEAAEAQVDVAELQKAGIEVSLESGIPADIEAAEADLELAQVEYDRNRRLVAQSATAKADLDRAAAELKTSQARISTLDAQTKQTQAQLNSAIATIRQSQQNLKDAQRNLADTTLYSAFRGQVEDVHVVPGSVVAQGTPVLTVQMMDPIKVEVQLSAEESRTIRRRHLIPVFLTLPDGTTARENGYVYLVDPSADPSTRTFTLTLLLLNRKIKQPLPPGYESQDVARSRDLWRLDFAFLPDVPDGTYFVDNRAILQDSEGHYVWRCVNATVGENLPEMLKVAKLRVVPQDESVAFLGQWTFRALRVKEGEQIDPSQDLIVGELKVEEGSPHDWQGEHVMLDPGGQWMLRPGDLVTVDLSDGEIKEGFHVPMEAIYEEAGATYVFVVDESGDGTTAKRIEVRVGDGDMGSGSYRAVEALTPGELADGLQIIVGGVHFLNDGDAIRATTSE